MKIFILFLPLALFVPFITSAPAQSGFVDGVDLTSIKAPSTLRVLGRDLDVIKVEAKPDEKGAYFMLTSESARLNVSVFIEPVDKCRSGEACRDYVLGLGNPAWGKYQDLARGKIKDFSYFEFYRPEVGSQPVKMFDMYAEYVDQGYWIDLHISKVRYAKSDHALFEQILNSISFVPKSTVQSAAFDAERANGERSAAAWLGLWDKQKCRETFTALSSVTRAENTETRWVDYCTKVNNYLGPNRSRKLIAAAYTSSLPPKTDQPVATLAYHSSFPKRDSVIELISLILEKDGTWSITNYFMQ